MSSFCKFPGGSDSKVSACRVRSLGGEDPLEKDCVVWKGFPAFPAHLRMRLVS